MNTEERAVAFDCEGARLCGIVHVPERPSARGVVVLVGGPQYRVGSHRQFVALARDLAAGGHPVLRFDHRGVGDSEGDATGFESTEADLRRAVDVLCAEVPGVEEIVVWGLCDAASAAMLFAHGDRRVAGLVLLNPWVRTERSVARAYLRHYYLSRLFSGDLWRKILAGDFGVASSLSSLAATALAATRSEPCAAGQAPREGGDHTLPARMADGLASFSGPILFIVSGQDLTAREFADTVGRSPVWRRLLAASRVERHELPEADHTFTRRDDRDAVARLTRNWLASW